MELEVLMMKVLNNAETKIKIINKRPDYSKAEEAKKLETTRADLYHIYKKYM